MRKLIFALVVAASCAAHAQSPNLGINRVYPAAPKPRAPETIEGIVHAAVPDRLSSIGRKVQEVQVGLVHSAEVAGRLRTVRAQTPLQKAELAANAEALLAQVNDQRRSLNFTQDTLAGMARQPLSQSERTQTESYLKAITTLKRHAQSIAGLAGEIAKHNAPPAATR